MALSDKGEIQALREIADRILVSLATYHYGEMEPWLDKGQVASGAQAAQILLGSRARSAILEGWNAEAIRVEIGPDGQNAATTVDLLYRATPNREARPVEFTFRFRRAQDGGWVLNLSPEP